METILAFTLMQRCLLNEDLINCVWSFEIEQISIAIDILSDRISSSKRHRIENYSESIFLWNELQTPNNSLFLLGKNFKEGVNHKHPNWEFFGFIRGHITKLYFQKRAPIK